MGRFLDVKLPPPNAGTLSPRAPGAPFHPVTPLVTPLQSPGPLTLHELIPNDFQKLGYFLLCVYIVSNLANDISLRLIGSRAYLSLIAGVTLPFVCLLAGTSFRFLDHTMGRFWLFMLFWMGFAGVFSTWRGGSFMIVQEFTTKNWVLLVYIVAVTLTLSQCRRLIHLNVFASLIVIVSCFAFGSYYDGRLLIPDSIFFENSNDLAIQLLISGSFVIYLLFSPRILTRLCGLAFSGATFYLLLKTGSRAGFLALVVCFFVALVISEHRSRMLAVVIPLSIVGIALMPAEQLKRLTYIVLSQEEETPVDDKDGALLSQMQRTELLKRSLILTLRHPLLGVGPGQFPEVVGKEFKAEGKRIPYLNTHNTYTQISSESGLLGLFAYLGVLFMAIRSNFRLYRLASRHRQTTLANMAFCLLIALTSYSVTSLFHHVAYSRQLPTLAGMSLALWFAARPLVERVLAGAAVPNPPTSRGVPLPA
jgi:O-antigen ligase